MMMPNLAAYGTWVFGRVVEGGYKFDPLHVSVAWGDGFDFAHLVPVEPVRTPAGEVGLVHPDCAWSDARLRTSAKCRSRTWSLDWLARAVERLVGAVETGKPTHHPQAADAKLVSLQSALTDAAWRGIQERYQAAELESLTGRLFARIYARDGEGARVDATGGRNENGADLIVFSQDALGIEYKVGVQVKNFQGVHDDAGALDQIKTARARHRIDAGVVLTTADETSDAFEKRREALESELGIDIKVIRRAEFLSLVLAHLGPEVSAT
ncbi:MAG: restriction endonuclease [Deltaproteobacteria bacterium]|nr:restriction endonuclease [Deltaproteobacteria bacterium]